MNELAPLDIYIVHYFPDLDVPQYICHIKTVFPSGDIRPALKVFASGNCVEDIRDKLPPGLYRLEPCPEDDPSIIETWI